MGTCYTFYNIVVFFLYAMCLAARKLARLYGVTGTGSAGNGITRPSAGSEMPRPKVLIPGAFFFFFFFLYQAAGVLRSSCYPGLAGRRGNWRFILSPT